MKIGAFCLNLILQNNVRMQYCRIKNSVLEQVQRFTERNKQAIILFTVRMEREKNSCRKLSIIIWTASCQGRGDSSLDRRITATIQILQNTCYYNYVYREEFHICGSSRESIQAYFSFEYRMGCLKILNVYVCLRMHKRQRRQRYILTKSMATCNPSSRIFCTKIYLQFG